MLQTADMWVLVSESVQRYADRELTIHERRFQSEGCG